MSNYRGVLTATALAALLACSGTLYANGDSDSDSDSDSHADSDSGTRVAAARLSGPGMLGLIGIGVIAAVGLARLRS